MVPKADNRYMYKFGRAAITKRHRLGGFKNIHLFFHSSRIWKSKIKVRGELGFSEASLLGL